MASLGMVLEQYPDEVVIYVTDPRTGIQRKAKWPPTISEIVEACDQHAAYLARIDRFKNWGSANTLMLEGPKSEKPTLEELQAKYGKNWGLTESEPTRPPAPPAPSWDEIAATYSADPSRLARLLPERSDS